MAAAVSQICPPCCPARRRDIADAAVGNLPFTMGRTARRRQITELVTPRLAEGEEILGAARAWAAPLGRTPLLFTGRHLHLLALTDRRLIAFERRHRRHREAAPGLDEPIDHLELTTARTRLTLYQVIVVASGDRRYVFEFRRGDHATGHALTRMLHATRQP